LPSPGPAGRSGLVLVQLSEVSFGYPGTEIFSGFTFQVNQGDRIGLVGPNGCGKSTLLRLLDGRLTVDVGQVARARGITLGYLKQSQEFKGGGRLFDALLEPFSHILAMREELSVLEGRLEDEKALARWGELHERYTQQGGYALESRVRALAEELGFSEADLHRGVDTLSGGERGRLELARTLLEEPDLLLLDEPTNHLDVSATEHLEARLSEWPKAFLLVSHDRYFLRAVCREIVEIEAGKAVRYPGGYDRYVEERAVRLERLTAAYERQREHISKTEDFIRRNIAGQKTKQAQSRRKMLEKLDRIERVEDEFKTAGQIGLHFSVGDHPGGKEALKTEALSVGYSGAAALVERLDLTIYRGDRVGIVGGNGCGKTTLLKTLLGHKVPLAGNVLLGHEVRIGYFDQKLSDLDDELSLVEEIRSVRGDFNEDVARHFLARFRFVGDDGFRKVKGLSGGERNRLQLAKMMLRPRNLLALDEPTNHLDIPACEVLEEALSDYEGTVIVISHDRYFLDRVVTKILHLDKGRWDLHPGNYSDFRARLRAEEKAARTHAIAAPGKRSPGKFSEENRQERPTDKERRIADREQKKAAQRDSERKRKRLAELEEKIAAAESQLAELNAALSSQHGGDWQKLHERVAEKEKVESRLLSFLNEWETLGSELEQVSADPLT
jgi:ATP-binding cassette subfamily F protein 3